jgi:hypothetical protein
MPAAPKYPPAGAPGDGCSPPHAIGTGPDGTSITASHSLLLRPTPSHRCIRVVTHPKRHSESICPAALHPAACIGDKSRGPRAHGPVHGSRRRGTRDAWAHGVQTNLRRWRLVFFGGGSVPIVRRHTGDFEGEEQRGHRRRADRPPAPGQRDIAPKASERGCRSARRCREPDSDETSRTTSQLFELQPLASLHYVRRSSAAQLATAS